MGSSVTSAEAPIAPTAVGSFPQRSAVLCGLGHELDRAQQSEAHHVTFTPCRKSGDRFIEVRQLAQRCLAECPLTHREVREMTPLTLWVGQNLLQPSIDHFPSDRRSVEEGRSSEGGER